MKAIILAAGKGTRLNGAIKPKCLVEIGGMTLLDRQISSLHQEGINEIVVVVGFEAGEIRNKCDHEVILVENRKYSETSSLYSLWLARDHMVNGFVVLNSDVLFHPEVLRLLLKSPHENALLLDYRQGAGTPMGDEEMKVKVEGARVVDISKQIDPLTADGENVGIVKFSGSGARTLVRCMDELIREGRVNEWAPRAFLEFSRHEPLHAVSTHGYPWIEIDFPEDYQNALTDIYPKIQSLSLIHPRDPNPT